MAWTTDLDAIDDPTTGQSAPASWGDAVADNFAYLGGAWTVFTPTWTGSGGNPSIGNGTLTGGYRQMGKWLVVSYYMLAGSTTTFGSGNWAVALPNSLTSVSTRVQTAHILTIDSSSGTTRGAIARLAASATTFDFRLEGSSALAGPTVPFTWATGDEWELTAVWEVA